MPSVLCAGSNSLPLESSNQPNRPMPSPTPCYSVAGSKQNGLNRVQHLSERCASGANNNLSLSHPKLLRLEALNRSFHNATNLANELKESLSNSVLSNEASTSSLLSNSAVPQQKSNSALPPATGSQSSPSAFVRHFSLKIKNHVKTSLSDSFRRQGSNKKKKNLDSPLMGK
jgi:hypothetical protein